MPFDLDYEDLETIVLLRVPRRAPEGSEPPPLPFPLVRRKRRAGARTASSEMHAAVV